MLFNRSHSLQKKELNLLCLFSNHIEAIFSENLLNNSCIFQINKNKSSILDCIFRIFLLQYFRNSLLYNRILEEYYFYLDQMNQNILDILQKCSLNIIPKDEIYAINISILIFNLKKLIFFIYFIWIFLSKSPFLCNFL